MSKFDALSKFKILIVDDEPDQHKLIRTIFSRYCPDAEITAITEGKKCLEAARVGSPDVIILDVKLPDRDGVDVCRELKRDAATQDIPVMLYSGFMTRPDERVRGLDVGANAYLSKPCDPLELVALVQSLLRLKQTQDQLRKRERSLQAAMETQNGELQSGREQLHYLFEKSPDAIFIEDLSGNVLEANAAAARLHGMTRRELIGMNVLDLVPPELRDEVRKEFPKWGDGDLKTFEGFSYAKDGTSTPVEIRCTPIQFNETPALLLHVRDESERMRHRIERERMSLAIEQVADIIIITDIKGDIEYVNPAFERITGYTRAEVIGRNPRLLSSGEHDAAFYQNLWDTITRGNVWSGRFINRRKNGSLFTEECTISPIRDDEGLISRYVGVMRDITREAEVENQLRQAQKMEAVGQLAGGVAHDFNNLLQVIINFTDIVLDDIPAEDSRHDDLEEVRAAAARACELTQRLLTFSRRQETRAEVINLNALIDNLLKMARRLIGEDIDLNFISGQGLGAVRADRSQMEQVVMNLCINARDAMPRGGKLTIKTEDVMFDHAFLETHAWAEKPGPHVLLQVTDTGCGIKREDIDRIFDPFFTTKEVGKGTGLGLATVYGIVRGHGGCIRVDSEVNQGTDFSIYLPQIDADSFGKTEDRVKQVVGGDEVILLAEDEPVVRKLAVRLLQDAGYTVLFAADGEEAVRLFRENADKIELALFDVVMPVMSGPDAIEEILKIRPDLPYCYVSAYRSDAMHGYDIPLGRLIRKPYRRDDLLAKIRELLNSAHPAA